jgi:hypothetical protein
MDFGTQVESKANFQARSEAGPEEFFWETDMTNWDLSSTVNFDSRVDLNTYSNTDEAVDINIAIETAIKSQMSQVRGHFGMSVGSKTRLRYCT